MADNPMNKGGIEVHTPNPDEYHPGLTGYGTTIPSASKDGSSGGFDPHAPGKVIVDPDMAGGDKVVDYAKFAKHKKTFNAKVRQVGGSDPDSAFRAISDAADAIEQIEQEALTPQVSTPPQRKENKVMPEKKIRLSPVEAPKEAQYPPTAGGDVRAATELAQGVSSSHFSEAVDTGVSRQLAAQTEVLSQLVGHLSGLQPSVEAPSPEVEVQTVSQVAQEAHEEGVRDKLIYGFETLEMPFITGPLAVKPKKEVYFEMPNMGTMAARYHEIQDGGTCLALIYDTRYEDGYQFMPPSLGDVKIKMTIPRENKVYNCSSLGIHFNCGVLDIVVLFKHTQEGEDTEEIL